MLFRTLAALVVFAVIGNRLPAQEDNVTINAGDQLVISMTGDLAKEYARLTCSQRGVVQSEGLQVQMFATIVQKLDRGRYRIEYSSHIIKVDGNPSRLVTLAAVVDATQIKSEAIPRNTPTYSSPADIQKGVKPTLTQKDQKLLRVDLSDLKNLKLRTWTLAEESGN